MEVRVRFPPRAQKASSFAWGFLFMNIKPLGENQALEIRPINRLKCTNIQCRKFNSWTRFWTRLGVLDSFPDSFCQKV